MKNQSPIAVLGGSGRTGKFLVSELLRRDHSLKLLLRTPEKFSHSNPSIEIIRGDATDPNAMRALLKNCQAVISTVGQRKDEPLVANRAAENIVTAMHEFGIRRYIFVAGININTPHDDKGAQTLAATTWMTENFPLIQEDRQQAFATIANSDIDWTLVRVPMIEFTEGRNNLSLDLKDCGGSKITADAIASFLVDALNDERHVRKAPFIWSE